jgi:hypothetical protein
VRIAYICDSEELGELWRLEEVVVRERVGEKMVEVVEGLGWLEWKMELV